MEVGKEMGYSVKDPNGHYQDECTTFKNILICSDISFAVSLQHSSHLCLV